jgi:hypothetical protein
MFISDHGCWILIFIYPGYRIPSPTTTKEEGGGNNLFSYLFCSHKFIETENYFIFEQVPNKNFSQLTKNFSFFYPKKLSPSSQKYGLRIGDPRSGIRKKLIRDP